MSDQWPDRPGPTPPLPHEGSPPLRGEPTPMSPASTSWGAPMPPPGVPSGRGRIVLVVVLVLLVALASSALTLWLTGEDDTTEAASSSSTTAAPAGPSTSAPGPSTAPSTSAPSAPVTEEELLAEVADLQDYVAEQRGHEFQRDVAVQLLDDDAFEERLLATLDEDRDQIETDGQVLSALGLVPPGTDFLAAYEQILGQGVLGFYDTETDELVVRGTELTPYTRQTIVHELVHALDDQLFELYRPEYDDRQDEVGQGFASVIEGNARRVEDAWVDTLSPAERDERNREEALYGLNADLTGVPPVLIELLVSPYEDGLVLIDRLLEAGGETAVDQALQEPPTSTEQVLIPDRYLAGEQPATVPTPPAEGEVIDEGTFGMLMLQIMLEDVMTPSEAFRAAEGWSGDHYVAWRAEGDEGADETGACVRIDLVMDGEPDVAELLDALEQYANEHPNLSAAAQGPTEVRVDACTPPPDGGGGGSKL